MVKVTDKDFYMDGKLKSNLDILAKHLPKDWDFMLLISGSGKVRVGKTMLGNQIGYYMAYTLKKSFSVEKNYCFASSKLKPMAKKLKPNSILVYDEAKRGLDKKRVMETVTKDLVDFFSECGYLNLFFIIILPDFFDLNKTIAIARSIALVNVYYKGEFQRGYFSFYNDINKKNLYIRGRDHINYNAWMPNFRGRFTNRWLISSAKYDELKLKALSEPEEAIQKHKVKYYDLIRKLYCLRRLRQKVIVELTGESKQMVSYIVNSQK